MNAPADIPTYGDFTGAEWRDAKAMGLRCGPCSPQADALVDAIIADLAFSSTAQAVRPTTVARRRLAVAALLADLLRAHADGVVGSRDMSRNSFSLPELGFAADVFVTVKDAMVAAGLLRFQPGRQRAQTVQGFGQGPTIRNIGGWVARFGFTPLALAKVSGCQVPVDAWEDHWQHLAPTRQRKAPTVTPDMLVQLKASSIREGGRRKRGNLLPVDLNHPMVQATIADLEAHNAFMAGKLEGAAFRGLRRVFNEGDKEDQLYKAGGRFFSLQGNGSSAAYETMKARSRLKHLRISGSPVAEVDLSASHLRLLYALQDQPLPTWAVKDPYGLTGYYRDGIKSVVAQTLGSGGAFGSKWGADAIRDYRKASGGRSLGKDHNFGMHRDATLEAHSILRDVGSAGAPSVFTLQFVESEIIRQALRTLRDQGIGALPVHDSLIVGVDHIAEAIRALQGAFRDQVSTFIGKPTSHSAVVRSKA